ncbi:MAG: alpha/beta hydrolase [Nitrososphaerota archaeon]|jgi:pimeloyl-ACP methyl ester carboxylesterase|nr:alpha/beta hydrolase [Nitrososphaerota archaeon]MDG6967500.1 alpha/beta hydrolase [Nitrososphaerota archaeon]MDG6978955.1 alpha/beta hydrolase [Nitrososphaerota archaeon]
MPTLEVEGVSLYYERAGSGDPVVLSHGVPMDHRAWSAQVEAFSKAYSTITYSRRYAYPNRRAGDLADSTVEANAADLRGLIEKLGVAPVHLVGHSYGGFVAAHLAAERPDLVRTLVLVEPAIPTLLVEDPDSTGQMFSLLLGHPGIALSARRFQAGSLGPSLAALDRGQAKKAVQLFVDGIQNRVGAFAELPAPTQQVMLDNAMTIAELRTRMPQFKEAAARVGRRTLVINGANTAVWLLRVGELAMKAIPEADAASIGRSRHFPQVENPQEFNSTVIGFLAKRR